MTVVTILLRRASLQKLCHEWATNQKRQTVMVITGVTSDRGIFQRHDKSISSISGSAHNSALGNRVKAGLLRVVRLLLIASHGTTFTAQ